MNRLGLHPLVLSQAGPKALAVTAKNWSESAHRFLKQCVNACNADASYTLGMVSVYMYILRLPSNFRTTTYININRILFFFFFFCCYRSDFIAYKTEQLEHP